MDPAGTHLPRNRSVCYPGSERRDKGRRGVYTAARFVCEAGLRRSRLVCPLWLPPMVPASSGLCPRRQGGCRAGVERARRGENAAWSGDERRPRGTPAVCCALPHVAGAAAAAPGASLPTFPACGHRVPGRSPEMLNACAGNSHVPNQHPEKAQFIPNRCTHGIAPPTRPPREAPASPSPPAQPHQPPHSACHRASPSPAVFWFFFLALERRRQGWVAKSDSRRLRVGARAPWLCGSALPTGAAGAAPACASAMPRSKSALPSALLPPLKPAARRLGFAKPFLSLQGCGEMRGGAGAGWCWVGGGVLAPRRCRGGSGLSASSRHARKEGARRTSLRRDGGFPKPRRSTAPRRPHPAPA